MNNYQKNFLSKIMDETLDEYISDCSVRLKKTNRKYMSLIDKRENILKKYPKVRMTIEDNYICDFNTSESQAVKKIFQIDDDISWIEEKELFYQGIKESYYLFKQMGIIK
jgi:protein-disulfide isomerase